MVGLLEMMLRQNPWWGGKGWESVQGLQKRRLFREVRGYMDRKQMIAVTGLRRVGKTTLLLQLIESLLQKVEAKRILYFSFDELLAQDPEAIENLLTLYENDVLKRELKDVYVFLDEINTVEDWQVILKRYYDLGKNIKFVVSGSSAIQLKKAKESLAGRIYEFELKPLGFMEFLTMRKIEVTDMNLQALELKREVTRYLMNGGFPEIANEDAFEANRAYVLSIVDKIIFSDIPKVYDVGNPEILKEIYSLIAKRPGSLIEYNNLAKTLNISYQTVSKYVHCLEKAYIIKLVYNFRGSPAATARKAKKGYLTTTTLALPVSDSEVDFISMMPYLVENAVVSHLNARFFWKQHFEIDVLHGQMPVEVKFGADVDIKNNVRATKKLGSENLVVITKDKDAEEIRDGITVNYIPFWKFLLMKPKEITESGGS